MDRDVIICNVIIDFHTHVVPPAIKNDTGRYVGSDPCFDMLYATPNPRLATAEELLESMDQSGVEVSVRVIPGIDIADTVLPSLGLDLPPPGLQKVDAHRARLDPTAVPAESIKDIAVAMTLVGGQVVSTPGAGRVNSHKNATEG